MVAACLLSACGGAPEQAPQAREWTDPGETSRGPWTLYYSALPSTDLSPEIAAGYGIAPRARLAIVSVSIVRGGDPKAGADATIEIGARDLLGRSRAVRTRRIARDGAVSWLGEVEAGDREMLVLSVRASLPGEREALGVEFRREFHTGS